MIDCDLRHAGDTKGVVFKFSEQYCASQNLHRSRKSSQVKNSSRFFIDILHGNSIEWRSFHTLLHTINTQLGLHVIKIYIYIYIYISGIMLLGFRD